MLSSTLAKIGTTGRQTTQVMRSMRTETASMNKVMHSAAAELPFLSRGLSMLRNPITGTVAAVGALAVGFKAATDRAAAFGSTFRDLANLNLGRTNGELLRLRNLIYDVAYAGGYDLNTTSRAFYDVQSITGMYGDRARGMVSKGMEFAKILRADPNEWVAGLAKAQANYGFSNSEVDRYQAAAYASLVAGAMTFDQLARSAPVFAGSAAASNQSYEDALKMFTLFTMRTKSTDEAATMTNSLFRDLTKKGTIQGFLAAGIDPYNAEGGFRSVVELMMELSDKFASQQNQMAVDKLRNAFQGSEGVTMMLNAAAGGAEQLALQLKNFKSAELDLGRARELARNDVLLLEEELRNRLNVSVTRLGEALLPLRINLANMLSSVLEWGNRFFKPADVAWRQYGMKLAEDGLRLRFGNPDDIPGYMREQVIEYIDFELNRIGNRLRDPKDRVANTRNMWARNEGWQLLGESAYLETFRARLLSPLAANANPTPGNSTTNDPAVSAAIAATVGGGRQQRVINVTIGSLVGTQTFQSTVAESRDDITAIVEEALVRAINGAEQLAVQ